MIEWHDSKVDQPPKDGSWILAIFDGEAKMVSWDEGYKHWLLFNSWGTKYYEERDAYPRFWASINPPEVK